VLQLQGNRQGREYQHKSWQEEATQDLAVSDAGSAIMRTRAPHQPPRYAAAKDTQARWAVYLPLHDDDDFIL